MAMKGPENRKTRALNFLAKVAKNPIAQVLTVSAIGLATGRAEVTPRHAIGTTALVAAGAMVIKGVKYTYDHATKENFRAIGNATYNGVAFVAGGAKGLLSKGWNMLSPFRKAAGAAPAALVRTVTPVAQVAAQAAVAAPGAIVKAATPVLQMAAVPAGLALNAVAAAPAAIVEAAAPVAQAAAQVAVDAVAAAPAAIVGAAAPVAQAAVGAAHVAVDAVFEAVTPGRPRRRINVDKPVEIMATRLRPRT